MSEEKFDAIVIGAGQSGPSLTVALAKKGKKVAIIERKHFGGTCINNGCIPSKTYVAHAKVAHTIACAEKYGMRVEKFSLDIQKIKANKDRVLLGLRSHLKEWIASTPNCTIVEGHATFASPHVVKVGDRVLRAPQIFIDVGARAIIPDIKGLSQVPYLTNSTVLDLEQLPKHLLIMGGGYVGVEFAQIFARFGCKVTILQHGSQLMGKEDPETAKTLQTILEKEGIEILLNVEGFEILEGSGPGNIQARFSAAGEKKERACSHLLLATGRRPNTDTLGVEKAGINVDKRGFIQVNDQLQTSQEHIWAMGECNGKGAFTHTSYNDFQIVESNLLENKYKSVKERIPIFALFVDPPLARIGMTEKEVVSQDIPFLKATLPMSAIPRAQARGETDGFLKILVHAETKEILGACFFGTGCDEMIHTVAEVMYAKKPYTLINKSVLIHPTVGEMLPTLLGKLEPGRVAATV
jgi:pyruvate/2-oxoglutarate dehydrogenase complex dihydrolipoamide dehydrogenase (E3) component